jgi:hypothetical protein
MIVMSANAYSGTITKVAIKTYSAISKSSKALPDSEIIKLSKLSDEFQGTKQVKKHIGKLNLPQDIREDLYLRIAVHQKKIPQDEAKSMFTNLKGKDGFNSTLSKIIGKNAQGTKGHLNELRIANSASKSGFEVVAIGKKFNDGIKNSLTDIDVLLRKNNKDILIEAKNYSPDTKMPIDKFKSDLDTLVIYGDNISKSKSIKVFSFTEKPTSKEVLKQYHFWAEKKGVQLIFGTPIQQIEQIKMLEKIL